MKKILLLLTLGGCGLEHRHSGEVMVNVNITSSLLEEVCYGELGLPNFLPEDLTPSQLSSLRQCMSEKLGKLLEALDAENLVIDFSNL
jgi:hypothetical protein